MMLNSHHMCFYVTIMRKTMAVMFLVLLLFFTGSGGERSVRVTVKNPADFDRKLETMTVSLRELRQNGIPASADKFTVRDEKTGASLPVRCRTG